MTVRCPSNGRRASSISALPAPAAQTSAGGTACPSFPRPVVLPCRPHRPHTAPTTHPQSHTCCYSPATADEPVNSLVQSYSPPRGKQLPSLPCLRVVPFLGLTIVHCPSALGVACSMWSTTDMHLKWTVRGEPDSWVHGCTQGNASLLRAK